MGEVTKVLKDIEITELPMKHQLRVEFDSPKPDLVPPSKLAVSVKLCYVVGGYVRACKKCEALYNTGSPVAFSEHAVVIERVKKESGVTASAFVYKGVITILCTGSEDHDLGVARKLSVELTKDS